MASLILQDHFVVITVFLQVCSMANGQKCVDLIPSSGMVVSETTGWVGDPPISITCEEGHVLDTGNTEKNTTCNLTSGNAAWSHVVGVCEKKLCPDITSMLDSNMNLHETSPTVSYYGDKVNVTCIEGYAFEIDHSLPVLDRVTSRKEINCIDENGSPNAKWEDPGLCQPITCSKPPAVPNSLREYTSMTINSTVVYRCLSGTSFTGYQFTLIASCNGSAEWSNDGQTSVHGSRCTQLKFSVGCLPAGSLVSPIETVAMDNGVTFCVQYCKGQNKGLAGVHNDTCWCADDLIENYVVETLDQCDMFCPVHNLQQQVFCGGSAGQTAVYATLHGCYDINSITTDVSEKVIGGERMTCRERCRGKDFLYSALQNPNTCHCFNTTQNTALTAFRCENESNSDVAYILNLAPIRTEATSCYDLYTKGIRMNGEYYLTTGKVNCVFSDGTLCEDGWIGFSNYCYYFNNTSLMNFQDGRDFCTSLGADLVSITTEEEYYFLSKTRRIHRDLWADESKVTWWLGLIGNANNLLYSWVDGSLMTLLKYHTYPDKEMVACAVDSSKHDYLWIETDCNEVHNVMCKKPAVGSRCVQSTSLDANVTETLSSMSVTYCSQFCKGKQLQFAVFENKTCHCLDSLPSHSVVNVSECNLSCPGHNFQYCGGDEDTYSVIDASMMLSAVSCEELQLYGIYNNTYHLQINATTEMYQYCGESACPRSWVLLNGSCYKYNMLQRKLDEAIELCAKEDSYMTTIETLEEVHTLMYAAQNISLYANIQTWRSGLLSLGKNGGLYRWSNGKAIELEYWDNDVIGKKSIVGFTSADPSHWIDLSRATDRTRFICEKGVEYVGCYKSEELTATVSYDGYSAMTIQQCVELCRVNSSRYAYLNSSSCVCENVLTTKEYGCCLDVCDGQRNQPCGGPDVMSVYDIDAYPLFESCNELYDAGIFISGTYNVSGSLQDCIFLDGTVCNRAGWLGFAGNCYKHFQGGNSDTHFDICVEYDAVQTSLTSVEEFATLLNYTRRVNVKQIHARVFTGITHGGYRMSVFISQDGFLTDNTLLFSDGSLPAQDLYDSFGYISFNVVHNEKFQADGGVICKEDKYRVGCYEKPTDIQTKLNAFGSMELGMCRQLCVRHEITLMGNDFCACATEAELSSFSMTSGTACNERCFIHSDQLCGNGSVMWAYKTNLDEDIYPRSCEHLYKNGIFYNTTYMIRTENGTVQEKQCGFIDDTSCKATWLGKNRSCFKILKHHHDFNEARLYCALSDSYIFNPADDRLMSFVQSFVTTSGLLDNENLWMTGITPVFYNISYVMSNGRIVEDNHVLSSNLPAKVTALDISSLTWINNDWTTKQPTLCQKDSDYLGCNIIGSVPDASYADFTGNSLTQCMYWCKGSNYNYAAVHQHECLCFHDYPMMTSSSGRCDIVCEAVKSQMCGGVDVSSNKLYNVVNTTNLLGIVGSCGDLFEHGVYKLGRYHLRINTDLDSDVIVDCFKNPPLLEYQFLTMTAKSVTASSTLSGQSVDSVKIVYPYTTVWKPASDDVDQFIKIVLDYEYIVTGFVMTGLHTSEEQSYITSFRLQYRDVLTGYLVDYFENSDNELSSNCDASSVLCFRFLTNPVVTNEIHLFPVTWYNSVSLQVAFAGQLFSDFNHSDTYIGCMLDPDSTFSSISLANDIQDCRTICRNELAPFAGIDDNSTCWCGHGNFKYGFVDDHHCPIQDGHPVGTGHYRAIHRTFCVVGDPFVGKTMLSVSYSANYVFKEYIPTVLNCYATTVMLDGRIIDIMIWDNSGSDEHDELRPLSYPQTDAFLLCFSLKSRKSLDNVLTKWLPEIDEYVRGRVPIVLVGCKRDDYRNSGINRFDMVSTKEGEEMASCIGAITYTETSAVEQSGFTSAFNSAVYKHCGSADNLMTNGHVTRVNQPFIDTNIYPYMTKVHYECNQGYELPSDIPDTEIECLQSNTWSDFTHNCTKIRCSNFTVENADVTFDSDLGTATVLCHPGYVTASDHTTVEVHCQHNKTWSDQPRCKDSQRSHYFKLHSGKIRDSPGTDVLVRSEIDCAVKCTFNTLCTGANYQRDPTKEMGGTCRLFEGPYADGEMQSDSDWRYLEISQ